MTYFQNPERSRASHAEHLRIYEALAKRDRAAAVDLVHKHLQGVDSYWQGLIDTSTVQHGRGQDEPFPILTAEH